jgi:glycosyltransferase involved in cell wall biosynthesis
MVTIGLPFCNDRRTLAHAIRSVFAQTMTDWQLVLVDDGSSDGSLELAKSVRDERVRVVSDRQNRGLPSRLNQIAALADSDYLARMDADDLMHPERLACQLDRLRQKPALDLVDSGLLSIDEFDQPTGQRCCHPLNISRRRILTGHVPVHASILARTEWFRANRYDARFRRAQDLELWCRVLSRRPLAVERLPRPLYFVREAVGTTYSKVRANCGARREILRRHGRCLVGWPRTQLALATVQLKRLVHWGANLCGVHHRLVVCRNRPLSDRERQAWSAVIAQILRTRVPGLDDCQRQMMLEAGQSRAA